MVAAKNAFHRVAAEFTGRLDDLVRPTPINPSTGEFPFSPSHESSILDSEFLVCSICIKNVIQGNSVSIDNDLRQVLDICKGDYKDALRMVLVANAYYEEEIERLKNEASSGYARGQRRKPVKRSG